MVKEVSVTVRPQDEKNQELIDALILRELNKIPECSGINKGSCSKCFIKKSVDARHGSVKIHMKYRLYIGEEPPSQNSLLPKWKRADCGKSVIIVGSGPAGLFGALKLLEYGIKPIIVERGEETSERRKTIAKISTKGQVDPDSNYCFGEGGAGTFSDGKLYTRSNKRGNIAQVLAIFEHFGADPRILTDAHPHIGTDKLPQVINSIKKQIAELGGELHFNTRCTGLIRSREGRVTGITAVGTKSGEQLRLEASAVMLATGHSATDLYELIAQIAPDALEAKTFAAGVRVEHPRALIDKIQYHGRAASQLGAAEYRLVTQVDGRGVYSFCMCPGGFVVPSASAPGEIVINGMSAAARNSKWSNSAIVVEIRPEDVPQEFKSQAEAMGCPALAGLLFRKSIEKKAFEQGSGQAAPAQLMEDFLENKKSAEIPPQSYTPGVVSSCLNEWLPAHIRDRLIPAFGEFNKAIKGFICGEALLIAAETRTSTPVKILRDKASMQSPALPGLYPAGEGSGYSGGIVSSAMDGIKVCEQLAKVLNSGTA